MTTTVKGAGAAKHRANRRHQQDTPLPPKGTVVTPAEVAERDASRAAEIAPGICPLAGCGRKHRAGTEIARMHAEAAEHGDKEVTVKPDKTAKSAETTAPVAGAKRSGKSAQAKSASAGTIPEGTPGAVKATRLLEAAAEAGWSATFSIDGPTVVVTVVRGAESIVTTLTDGKLDLSAMPLYSPETGRSVKLKNVSAVIHQMAGDRPGLVKATRETATRTPRRSATARSESGERKLPFDPTTATDEEILESIRGRVIEWMNGISRKVESATVLASRMVSNPRYKKGNGEPEEIAQPSVIGIAPHPNRQTRVVTFTDSDVVNTRSVALDRLITVK